MTIFFVRHSKAIDRSNWLQDDLKRPLSDKGVSVAKGIFKAFSKIYDTPEYVLSSEASRALETAHIMHRYSPDAKFIITNELNPGFNVQKFRNIIESYQDAKSIVLIGHEPDFGLVVSNLLNSKSSIVDFKKCAIAEVELSEEGCALKAFIPPKVLV